MLRFAFFLAFLAPLLVGAQEGDVYFGGGKDLHEGLYRDFQSFRQNVPSIPLGRLRTSDGLAVNDIRRTTGKLYWQPDTGDRVLVDLDRMWGFCQNGVVYIGGGNGFYRIGLMGSLSHLVVEQMYRDWDPYMYNDPYGGSMTRTVLVQKLLDMKNGSFLDFTASGMDQALQHDQVLLEEFRALPKKTRNSDEALFRFLRMYNDRNPLSFPQ